MISIAGRTARLPSSSRYEFQKVIGSGGMGTVYRAFDRRTEQLVAIKVLKFKLSENPMMHQRLAMEFRAASGLEHPNIVRALSVENDGEISFLVYELVETENLGARIDQQGRLPEEVSIRIATQVAQALHFAHQRQIIHRDVKPDNIMLLPDGKVKLTDFGLAKDFSEESQELTRQASGLGTPHFMAPEQFADARKVDARCDVYSLAATLYNTITGELPFDAKFPLAILTNKELGRLTPVRTLAPEVSEHVELAIQAGLDPNPERRPSSCLAFFKLLTRRLPVTDLLVTPAPQPVQVAPGDDRRTNVRYMLKVGSYGLVEANIHECKAEDVWPLVIQDVSAGGMGVQLARRFEPGTELSIELILVPGEPPQRISIKVVRVQPARAGHWIHGCSFVNPLPEQQLKVLLKFA